MPRYVKEEIKLQIIPLYQKGNNIKQVSKQLKCGMGFISNYLKLNNIPIRSEKLCKQKYFLKPGYFDKIDSHEKAYFLGFLYADGHNYIKERRLVTISLEITDKYILEYFSQLIHINERPIIISDRRHDNKGISSILLITNKECSMQLEKLGMKSGKTQECHLPILEKEYYSSFVLGYFDGDGSIYLQKTGKKKKTLCGFVDIISNNYIINELIKLMKEEIGVYFKQKFDPSGNYSHMYICNAIDIKKFYDYVYKYQKVFLTRKHNLFLKFLEYTNQNLKGGRYVNNNVWLEAFHARSNF